MAKDDDNFEIPVKVPISWLKKFAGHIITVCVVAVGTAVSAWFTQAIVSKHQQTIVTNQEGLSSAQAQIVELTEKVDDLEKRYLGCKRDLSDLKRVLGITETENGDVTVRHFNRKFNQ